MKTFLLLAGMLLAAPVYGQMASVKVTSSDNTMPCSTKILTFDAHDPDGIYSVTVQTKMVWNHQTVYEYKRLPAEAGVVDSSFSVDLVTNTDNTMEYKVILETKNGLVLPIDGIFIQNIPSRAARNPKYANTIKFTNYFEECQPVKVGAKVIPHFVGSCDQYSSSFDTTMVVKPGELVITIWGDDPATPYIDGFQDGDWITMFDLSENDYNEFETDLKFDAKRNINDTVFSVGESASGLNYSPDFIPYTNDYNFGTVNKPTTKQIVFANSRCNKSLQPKIVDIKYTDYNGIHYSHKITSDTTFEITYDAKGEGITAIDVLYELFPQLPSPVIKSKMFFFEGYSGDHQVNICVKDELGQTIRPQAYQGVDPSDITVNAFYNDELRTGVPDGWTSSVSVTHAKYRMVPSAISINNLNKDTVLNFVAMFDGKYKLKAIAFAGYATINTVTDAPVTYNVNGKIVPSDSIGQFTDSLPARWSGFIVPVVKDYTFDTLKIASFLQETTYHIRGTYTGTYTLSGVCASSKGPIAGVMVIAGTDTVTTDNLGVFSFQKPVGWSGKLAISKPDYSFVNPADDYVVSSLTGPRTNFSFYGGESQVYFFDMGIKYRIEHNKKIDTDGDGIIQVREARAFTGSLDFTSFDNRRDLLALSYFVNIEVLVLTNSDFTSIDLSPFTHLVGLVAGGSSFEFLDISANTELQFVNTDGSADLAVICGGNPNITYTKDGHTAISSSCSNLFSQSIKLDAGWNMISINFVPRDNTIKSLFAGLNVLEIKTMDAYWRAGQPEMFNSLRAIATGEGYLVNMKTAGELKISGTPLAAINYMRDKSQSWKLIGTPFQSPTDFSELYYMLNCKEIKDFNGFWRPNATGNNMSQFEPGKAYFVK